MKYLALCLSLAACGAAGADPVGSTVDAAPLDAGHGLAVPDGPDDSGSIPERAPEVAVEAAPEALAPLEVGAPVKPAPGPPGFHDAGGCLLPTLHYGDCACGVGRALCFDSCHIDPGGRLVAHAFCVDGGVP